MKCLYTHVPLWYEEHPSPVLKQISSTSSSEFYCSPGFISSQGEIQEARNTIDTIAKTLKLPPIGMNDWNNEQCLKDTYNLIIEAIQTKFETAGNLKRNSNKEINEVQCFNEMIDQLKEKSVNSTATEKYLLLSVENAISHKFLNFQLMKST